MAKTRTGKRDLESFTIRGTNKVVRAGDSVLMRPLENEKNPYVARVERVESDVKGNVKVQVRWYYRPEEAIGGRQKFHGSKELFLSDHYDTQSANTIEGKCIVHTFKNYTKLRDVGAEDYFCRFEYKAANGGFNPDSVAVYHPECLNMTIDQAKEIGIFTCSDCSSVDSKRSDSGSSSSALVNDKEEHKRKRDDFT
ncbi:Bromo adjacent homology (BAH) domain-containing protein [Cynara cardunculus var. scolymus]|uniref:Bromo adjacent homology (BAH) domain-containing protein n=1 Tax=Cynara cardunculus var. scolymus TaxID=59895 RepID=A0A118K098_CYNCS|nr:Bromo adjacent homology (BAH) domain-containing protein [Cynara cardunculus var. scolymus]